MPATRFLELSPARQALVRIMQAISYGELQVVRVQNVEPVLKRNTVVVFDAKLDKDDPPRPEQNLADFALNAEVLRLMARFDELRNSTIRCSRCGRASRGDWSLS